MADTGKTMGYEQATGTELSGSKYLVAQGRSTLGEWTDTPDPVFTGSSGVTHVYQTSDGYGTKQFDIFGRRPYSVSIINDRTGDIFFLFEKNGNFINYGDNRDDNSVTTFEIAPIAWSGSHASSAAGDVLFLYRGDQ